MNATNRYRWLSVATPLALLALWELVVQLGLLNRIFYPPPSEVVVTFGRMLADGSLWRDVSVSLGRVALGMLFGGVPAVVVGLLMGISPAVRAAIRPLAAAIYPIPKIALLPLVIVLLGIGEVSKVATIAISVFFLVVLNVAASVEQIDPRHFEVARSFGASRRDLFWTVALPASLPGIMNSLKLGIGFALTLIIGVEFVGADDGVGHLIWNAYEIYAIDKMIGGLVAVALVGWLVTVLIDTFEQIVIPWQGAGGGIFGQQSRIWWRAMRPWSFTAAAVPVLLGGAIASTNGTLSWWLLLLTLVATVALQAGTNLLNDYYDFQKGTDGPEMIGVGGAIQRGDLAPRQVLVGGLAAFGFATLIGAGLAYTSGPLVIVLGLIGLAIGYFYTAGPLALAYNGLGELAVFVSMGPLIVIGAYYVQTSRFDTTLLLNALPVGFLVAAILHANNLRDLELDRQAGKRTLATLLGRGGARVEYYLLLGGTYASLVAAVALRIAPWPVLIALLTVPLALRLVRIAATGTTPTALQPVLRQTAQLHSRFGALLVVGWFVALLLK